MFSQASTIDEAREALRVALSSKTMSLADRVSGLNNAVMGAMEFDLEESETSEASERADQLSELLGFVSNAQSQGYRADVIESLRGKHLPRAQELCVIDTAEVVKAKSMVRRYDTVLKQLNSAMASKNEQILTQACSLAQNLQIDAPEVALAQAALEEIIDDQVLRGERPFSPISAGSMSPALSIHTGPRYDSRPMSVHSEVLPYSPANALPGSALLQTPSGPQGFWKSSSERVAAAKNILSNEKEYLKKLKSVVEVFRKRLHIGVEKGYPILDENQIGRVFVNVADIHALTSEFVDKIDELANTSDDELLAKIGQVFMNFMPRFESEYVSFRRDVAGAVASIEEFSQSNSRFDEFLKTNESFESINLSQTFTDDVAQHVPQYIDLLTKLKVVSEAETGQSAQMAVFIYDMALQKFQSLVEKAFSAEKQEATRVKAEALKVKAEAEAAPAAKHVADRVTAPTSPESKVADDTDEDLDITDVEEDDDDSDGELQAMLDARKAKIEARRKKKAERKAKGSSTTLAVPDAVAEPGDDADESGYAEDDEGTDGRPDSPSPSLPEEIKSADHRAFAASNGKNEATHVVGEEVIEGIDEGLESNEADEYDDNDEFADDRDTAAADTEPDRGDTPVPDDEDEYSKPYPIEDPEGDEEKLKSGMAEEGIQQNGDTKSDVESVAESVDTVDSTEDTTAQLPQTQALEEMMTPPASPMGAPLSQSMNDLELGGNEEEPEISEEEKKRLAKLKKDRRKRAELEKAKKMLAAEKSLPTLQSFVEKKSPVRFGPWQRRWLTVSQYNLFYGRQQINVKNAVFALDNAMNCIPLMVVQEIKAERSRDQRQFYVSARDLKNAQLRRYLFRTKTTQERDSWVTGLNIHKDHLEELLKCPAIRLNTVKTAPRDPHETPSSPKKSKSKSKSKSGASTPRSKRS